MLYKLKRWGCNTLAVCLFCAAMLAAGPAGAATFEVTRYARWSQFQITKYDTVIVDTGATLTVDVGSMYGYSVCSAITVNGVLQFGTDAYTDLLRRRITVGSLYR